MKAVPHKILILSVFIIISFAGYTQHTYNIDSLQKALPAQKEDTNKVSTLNALSDALNSKYDYKNSILYADKALTISEKLNYERGKADAYYNIGYSYSGSHGDFQKANMYLNAAMQIFKKKYQETKVADCYFRIGVAYYSMQSNVAGAQENTLTALRIYEKAGSKNNIANCFTFLAQKLFRVLTR